MEEPRGRAKVANFSNIIRIFSNNYYDKQYILSIYYDNKCDSKQTFCFSNTILHYLVELDEYEDAAEITEAQGDVAGEVSHVKNVEIPDIKSDVTTPANPEQLRLEVN